MQRAWRVEVFVVRDIARRQRVVQHCKRATTPQMIQRRTPRDGHDPSGKRRRFAQRTQQRQRAFEHILRQIIRIRRLHATRQHAMHHRRKPAVQRIERTRVAAVTFHADFPLLSREPCR